MRVTLLTLALAGATAIATLGLADSQAAPQRSAASSGRGVQATTSAERPSNIAMHADPDVLFKTSGNCMPCHNSLTTPSGEDVSIGASWRGSIMANSSRDPYWQASVRREMIDHPTASADIQDECSLCHMPMAATTARANGRRGEVFAHLPIAQRDEPEDLLAHDGVSCTMCHQISSEKFGTRESFTGGFVVAGKQPTPRSIFGPFDIENGLKTVMRSSSEFQPTEAPHIRQSELCATCHTLYTKALNAEGQVVGALPEQMMYLEWRHSAFPTEQQSCGSCHMPVVQEQTPVASVLGPPRAGMARHVFTGGNSFVLRMLNRYRAELGVEASPQELDASVRRTVLNLATATATITVEQADQSQGRLNIDLQVSNLTGHKLPTAYPSRRAWVHLTVKDRTGRALFESGAIAPSGLIEGNENDADALRYEPHYTEIRQPDQVQIYESMMVDGAGAVTTGLLSGLRYIKDNRLLPRGFAKDSAQSDIAVIGAALQDEDFTGGGDRIRYSVDVANGQGPFHIDVEMRFQPIGFRWAQNLKPYDSPETRRFVAYFDSMGPVSSEVLARTTAVTR